MMLGSALLALASLAISVAAGRKLDQLAARHDALSERATTYNGGMLLTNFKTVRHFGMTSLSFDYQDQHDKVSGSCDVILTKRGDGDCCGPVYPNFGAWSLEVLRSGVDGDWPMQFIFGGYIPGTLDNGTTAYGMLYADTKNSTITCGMVGGLETCTSKVAVKLPFLVIQNSPQS